MRSPFPAIQRHVISAPTLLLCGLSMALMAGSAHAAGCPIDGPSAVSANESFTLCGVAGSGYTYEWIGQDQAPTSTSRCLTESGRSAGTYEYQLIVRRYGNEIDRCSRTVTVGSGGFGTLTCAISGPTSIAAGASANLCAPQASRHSYRWTGPGGFTASTACVTASVSGTYRVSIINDLTGYARECSHTLTVGSSSSAGCAIDGPDVVGRGSNVQLCAPASSDANYRWDGPNNFVAASRCVVVDVPGTYYLTLRSRSTGAEDQCSHVVNAVDTGTEGCTISGPSSIGNGNNGNAAELCAESASNSTYSWIGPGNFRSSLRCIRATSPGLYRVSIRNQYTRFVRECSFTLDAGNGGTDGTDDGDVLTSSNCPRALPFWQQQCQRAADGRRVNPNDFVLADMQAIARRVDELSTFFNWSDDVNGLCAALNPVRPLTNRKQAIRHYAALLANVAAGELDLRARNGDAVSLDPQTSGRFSSATTISELIALTERMLASGRGSFSQLSQQLNAVNRGRGIGPVCQ